MPKVSHLAQGVPHNNGTPAPSVDRGPPKTAIFRLLDFIGDEGKTTAEVGRFLGVQHKAQAIQRGSVRIKGLLGEGIVYRGTQKPDAQSGTDHAVYHLTDYGKRLREARTIIAKPKDLETLAGKGRPA